MNIKKYVCALLCAAVTATTVTAATDFSAINVSAADVSVSVTSSQFGAKGNDKKDDTNAFQQALNLANNSDSTVTIKVPAGTYYISSHLRLYSNTKLVLDDKAVIKRNNDSDYIFIGGYPETNVDKYSSLSNVTISGGTLDGNVKNTNKTRGVIKIDNAKNISLIDTNVKNVCGTHFVLIDGVANIKIKNCTFSNFIDFVSKNGGKDYKEQVYADYTYRCTEAIHIDFLGKDNKTGVPCKNVTVTNCTFSDLTTGIGTHHVYKNMSANNIVITNNVFKDCYYYCMDGASFTNLKFANNKATNVGGLCYVQDTSGIITNNTITTRMNLTGKMYSHDNFADNSHPTLNGIRICDGCKDLTVSYNTIKGATENGIYVLDGSVVNINNNTISNAHAQAIIGNSNSTFITATSNYIYDCKKTAFLFMGNAKGKCTYNNIRTTLGANLYTQTGGSCTFTNNGSDKSDSYGSKKCLKSASFSIPTKATCTGKQIKPSVKTTLRKGTDFTVTYGKNINGQGTVKITGKGVYAGSFTMRFKIIPKKAAISNLVPATKKLVVNIKKDTNATGYQIKYSSTSKTVDAGKTVKITSNSATRKTLSLSKNKKYYVKVRAYKTINGTDYYGAWSTVKSIVTL